MLKVLFIALHRPDRSPSQRFRYEQYLNYLEENGWQTTTSYLIEEKWDRSFYASGKYLSKLVVLLISLFKRFRDLRRADDFDVIFVQREAIMIGSSFFEKRFSKSKAKLIFDFDDAIWLPNVSNANQNLSWLKQSNKTARILSFADFVIAGNRFLADYALKFNQNVVVFPTTIDTNRHIPASKKKENKSICIGWTGSSTTIQHFERAIPMLLELKQKYGDRIYFKVIGDGSYKNEELSIQGINWSLHTEIQELIEIDIGIMPLPNDSWSKGKCGLKCLQYMSLEIPCVVSPVGINKEIVQDGVNGFLADSADEWVEKISFLIDHEEERRKLGIAARQKILADYSVDSKKKEYLNYFNRLAEG